MCGLPKESRARDEYRPTSPAESTVWILQAEGPGAAEADGGRGFRNNGSISSKTSDMNLNFLANPETAETLKTSDLKLSNT